MYTRIIASVAVFFALSCPLFSQTADLASKINAIVAAQEKKKVEIGIEIIKAQTGEKVYIRNAEKAMIPASNMKLATSAGALHQLGPSFEYVTKVGLLGDKLVIIGSGDPLFGDPKFDKALNRPSGWIIDKIIQDLKLNSVTSIGGIIIDRTVFDTNSIHPNWPVDQLQCWYAAQVSGLNYNDNCVSIFGKTVGSKTSLTLKPSTSYIKLVNNSRPQVAKKASGLWCNRQQGTNIVTVQGSAQKYPVEMEITVDKPAGMFAYILAENLSKSGIAVGGVLNERLVKPDEPVRFISEFRTPIKDVIARCNKDSLQLAAECLLKTAGAYSKPWKRWGSWETGRQVIGDYLLSINIPAEQFVIDDGCGLSRHNRISPHALAAILLDQYRSPNWKMFADSLAIGGEDGTIDRFFKEAKFKGKILGKTGYINGVKSFSGVAMTSDGDYIFAIITNKATGPSRDAINRIVQALF